MKKYVKEYNRNFNMNYASSLWNATTARIRTGRRLLFTLRKDNAFTNGVLMMDAQKNRKGIQKLSR